MPKKHKTLAIAFGSGGARALASLGVMSVLLKHNVRPVKVTGCSMGSLIAAYYAVHLETDTLKAWYESKRTIDYFSYLERPRPSRYFIGTRKLEPLLKEFIKDAHFEDTKIPLSVVTTNLRTGAVKVFRKGPIAPTLMASSAIPAMFPPYKIGAEYYVDGGLTNPTPVNLVRADIVLGIDYLQRPIRSLKDPSLLDTVFLATDSIRRAALRRHLKHTKATIIHPLDTNESETFRFDKVKEYIRKGERAGERLIKRWKHEGIYGQLIGQQPKILRHHTQDRN